MRNLIQVTLAVVLSVTFAILTAFISTELVHHVYIASNDYWNTDLSDDYGLGFLLLGTILFSAPVGAAIGALVSALVISKWNKQPI